MLGACCFSSPYLVDFRCLNATKNDEDDKKRMLLVGDSVAKITAFAVTSARSKSDQQTRVLRASRRINRIGRACQASSACYARETSLRVARQEKFTVWIRSAGFLGSEEPLDRANAREAGAGVFERARGDASAWNLKGERQGATNSPTLGPVSFA